MQLDATDHQIIVLLTKDAKLSYKAIGEQVHMTGQAVGARVSRLLEEGIIEGYTIRTDPSKLGKGITALVKIFMNTSDHQQVVRLINNTEEIAEAHRISGGGCYQLKLIVDDNEKLNAILDQINAFANYQLSISIGKLK